MTQGLCTAIEPVSKAVMCQLEVGHRGEHYAEGVHEDGGRWTATWFDASHIRAYFRALAAHPDNEQPKWRPEGTE